MLGPVDSPFGETTSAFVSSVVRFRSIVRRDKSKELEEKYGDQLASRRVPSRFGSFLFLVRWIFSFHSHWVYGVGASPARGVMRAHSVDFRDCIKKLESLHTERHDFEAEK